MEPGGGSSQRLGVRGKSFTAFPATPPAFQDAIVSYDVAFVLFAERRRRGNALTARRFDAEKSYLTT